MSYINSFSKEDVILFIEDLESKESNQNLSISYNYFNTNTKKKEVYEVLDARSRLATIEQKEQILELETRLAALESKE